MGSTDIDDILALSNEINKKKEWLINLIMCYGTYEDRLWLLKKLNFELDYIEQGIQGMNSRNGTS